MGLVEQIPHPSSVLWRH